MTREDLLTLAEAVDQTNVWAFSPEGSFLWSNLHSGLINLYDELENDLQVDELYIYNTVRNNADLYRLEQENSNYAPIYTIRGRTRMINSLIVYTEELRQIDNELSRFILELIIKRHQYDFKRRIHAFNAAN